MATISDADYKVQILTRQQELEYALQQLTAAQQAGDSKKLDMWQRTVQSAKNNLANTLAKRPVAADAQSPDQMPGYLSSAIPQLAAAGRARTGGADTATQYSASNVAKLILEQTAEHDRNLKDQQAALGRARDFSYSGAVASADQARQIATVGQQIQQSGNLIAEDPNNLHAQLSAALFANDKAYEVERAKHDELASKSLLDDPLGWVMAQIELPTQAAKVNALAGRDKQLQSTFQRTIAMDRDAKAQMQANTVATQHNIALTKAEQDRAEADARIAALGAQGASAKMTAISTAAAALDRAEEDPLRRQIRELQRDKLKDEQAQRQLQEAQNFRAAQWLGLPAPAAEKDMTSWSPQIKQDYEKLQQTGVGSPELMVELGKGLIGTPREVEYIAARNTMAGIQAEVDAVRLNAKNGGMSEKDARAKGREQYYAGLQSALADARPSVPGMLNKAWDVKNNIYRPNHVSFMQDQAGKVAAGIPPDVSPNNMLMRMLLQTYKAQAPGAANGNITVEQEKQTVQAFADLQAQGKLIGPNGKPISDAAAAAQIAEYYRAATKWNNMISKPTQLGFAPMTAYRGELTTPYTEKIRKVDLLSPAEVENWMVTYGKERKLLHAPFRGNSFNLFN